MNRVLAAGASALGLIALVVWLWTGWNHANRKIAGLELVQSDILRAARIVTDNPKLEVQGISTQLTLLASTIDGLRESERQCSARVDALGAEQVRLSNAAVIARKAASGRIEAAERGRASLEASALGPVGPPTACLSDELRRRWK